MDSVRISALLTKAVAARPLIPLCAPDKSDDESKRVVPFSPEENAAAAWATFRVIRHVTTLPGTFLVIDGKGARGDQLERAVFHEREKPTLEMEASALNVHAACDRGRSRPWDSSLAKE